MIQSSDVNKVINEILTPVLKEHDFSRLQTRKNWKFNDETIWVLEIKSVGNYFSKVTGWPPESLTVSLGIFYKFLNYNSRIKVDTTKGLLLPTENYCHRRLELLSGIEQGGYTKHLENPAERNRTDIWWINRDGSNLNDVMLDIRNSFLNYGLKWFETNDNKEKALIEIGNGKQLMEGHEGTILINYPR